MSDTLPNKLLSIEEADHLADTFDSPTTKAHYKQLADVMREVERLRALMHDASKELSEYCVGSDGEGESYNNERVIALTAKIDECLAAIQNQHKHTFPLSAVPMQEITLEEMKERFPSKT